VLIKNINKPVALLLLSPQQAGGYYAKASTSATSKHGTGTANSAVFYFVIRSKNLVSLLES